MYIISKDTIKIKHLQTQKFMVIKTQNSSKLMSVKFPLDNFFAIFRKVILIIGNLNEEKFSEIPWIRTGNEQFIFYNLNICIIFNGEGLFLIEFGKNEILFSKETKAIEKMKGQYYDYLVKTNQLDKAAKFKEQSKDLTSETESNIEVEDPIKAADLFMQKYNESNFDKNLLEKIIKKLTDLNLYEKLGDIYEKIGQHKNAINAFRKAKSFSKAIALAKKNNLNCIKKLEEEWGILFFNEKDYENSITHFIEAGNYEKAISVAINFLNNGEKAIELVNKYQLINPSYLIQIGNYFRKELNFEKAEEYFIKGGEPLQAFNMYINDLILKNKERYNNIIGQIDKFKQFFEEIEKNNKLPSGERKQFNEEEKNIINQKFADLKTFLFSEESQNEIYEKPNDTKNIDENINNIYSKIMDGNINKNELNEETIYKLLAYGKTIDEIEKILKLCKNLLHLLNIIYNKFDYLLNIYKEKYKKINIDEIIEIETDSLVEIKKIHELLLQKEKESNYEFIEFEMIIIKHINFFQNADLKNLLILKEMIDNHKKYLKNQNALSMNIDNTIKNTVFYLINQNSLNSRQIIDLILKLGIQIFVYREQEIFYSINIYDLNEDDISQFNKLWELIIYNQHLTHVLVRIIISKIKTLKDFGFIFKLIPDYIFDKSTIKELEDNFKYLFFYNYNIKSCENILNDIYKILEIMVSSNYPIKNFLVYIEASSLSKNKISNLYLRVIQDIKLNQNEELKISALTYLIEKNMISDFNSVYSIVQIIGTKNKNLIKNFLYIIGNFTIKEEDFFNPIMTNKFKLYITIFQYFPDYHYLSFIKDSNKSLSNLYNKLYNKNLTNKEFIKITKNLEDNDFQEKIIAFNMLKNDTEEAKKMTEFLKREKGVYNLLKGQLVKCENFLKTFFGNEEKNNIDIIIKNKNLILNSKNIGKDLNTIEKFISNSNIFKDYKDYFRLFDSRFFMALYKDNSSKKNDDENLKDIFNKTIKDFLNLVILNDLNEDLNINEIPSKNIIIEETKKIIKRSKIIKKDKKQECLSKIKNELNVINEINMVLNKTSKKNINVDINEQNSDDIFITERKLIYLSYYSNIKRTIQSLIFLIDLFKVNKTDIYQKINDKKNEIDNNDNVCLKDIINYIKFLKELKGFEIDITIFDKSENNSVFVEFLTILDNNEEEMEFLIGKKNNEIKALSEFIGESENSKIQIGDIQDFINICDFFENMKALNVQNDIELIEEFKTAFVTAPSFANSFSNYLNNFKEIKSVYEEFLDKPEMSRNKIEQILKYSNIDIYFDNDSRSFIIEGAYNDIQGQSKKFNYNDLLELNDRALLFCNKIFDKKVNDLVENFEDKKKNSEFFIDLVENITQLKNYLFSLYMKGYPFSLKLVIHIENNIALCNGDKIEILLENYIKLSEDLENEQTKAYSEKSLIRLLYGHQFYDIYNYLFNKKGDIDIMPLLKRLSNNKIFKLPVVNDINNNIDQEDNEQKFNTIIDKINNFLIKCLQFNGVKLLDLYKNNLIKKNFENKLTPGFYIWVDDMKLDINIINVYKTITGNLPLSITILLCTKETNEEEITSFIYRIFLCEYKVLFIIIGSDNLELSKAQYLLWILESLYIKYKEKIKSTLLITFTDINSDLKKELAKLRGHQYFISSDFINKDNIKKDLSPNFIEVWSSDAPGVGKSVQIKMEAKKNNKNYIYFPIGGVSSRKDIINRLEQLSISKQNINKTFFHIDIYDSNEETSLIIKEFLFSLIITRSYSYDEKIFYLDYGVKIVIEIPIGFYDMKDKFILLDYFPQKKISLERLPNLLDLEKENKNITDIQLITNILIMIENGTIEDNVFDLDKKHKEIPIEQCQSIINKYFTLTKGNYYQKIAFIHILADQLRKFCLSFYLNPEILLQNESVNVNKKRFRQFKSVNKYRKQNDNKQIIENNNINQQNVFKNIEKNFKVNEIIQQNNIKVNVNLQKINNNEDNNHLNNNIYVNNKNEKNNNYINDNLNSKIYDFKITSVRKIMINNLIKLTLHFIKGPFTKMILNQKSAITQIFGEFNEKKINEIANIYLSNADEERISFEKINPSLVFFNEDVQTFSIITTSKSGEEEYEQLLRLYNSQNHEEKEIPLINYRNLTHEQFLSEIKNVLNLNELSIEDIKKIIGSYCFTSDNFIKMILILLRIRAGIPVIMMGETGCGKTSLIKTLSALLNRGKMNSNIMKIMNIHAGIKDKDIIDFIEKINQELIYENKKDENNINYNTSSDKIWVFFDEINTCNSMGLLSEIFYKHTYYGKKLNNKLTFIAACNPYRLKLIKNSKNEEDDFCLTLKDKKYSYNAKQNLVYHVNPLPHSLLTSIFDFGHLSSEDEKKYIKNIVKETLQKYKANEEIENLFVEEIFGCQNFVREHNDISSVSLRDLRRFNLLFEFFMKYLEEKKENNEKNKILIDSMCLSLYFCYYIGLSNNKLRKELKEKINQKFKNGIFFEDIILKEKEFLISTMKIPSGIAKNRTLKENIFVLFVSIINKIPLIMCGKPGTSKSLSFQILYDSMKGERSDSEFLKKYPEILIFSYQGSKTSTSEGVQKVFTKVKNSLKKYQERKLKNLLKFI